MPVWANSIRTPEGIIPISGEKDTYWLYFTAGTDTGFHCFGRMKIKISRTNG